MKIPRRVMPNVHIDVTPLIDVVFLLLLFFMLSSVFRSSPAIDIKLPVSGSATKSEVTSLRIVVADESHVWVDGKATDLANLGQMIVPLLAGRDLAKLDATLEADENVPYKVIIGVLDVLRANKLDGARLLTRQQASAAKKASGN